MRDFIDKKEGKLTIIRFVGFCLLLVGMIALVLCSFYTGPTISNKVGIFFFITMLGFSLAFPSMLEGHEGLSTMRIITFMVTNIICMLLLRIGWGSNVDSFDDIKIDEYWVGIIAFVFGAKATQSFFESRMAAPKASEKSGAAALEFNSAEVAKLAVLQNEQYLRVKFPNILTVSDTVDKNSDPVTHVVAIYLKNTDSTGIPSFLEAKMPDNSVKSVETEIIEGSGTPKIQYSQLDSAVANEQDPMYVGSVCCGVKSADGAFKGLLTSAHIYTFGNYTEIYNGYLNPAQQSNVLVNGNANSKWFFKMLTKNQDLAVVKFSEDFPEDGNYKSFNNEFYVVEDKDVKTASSNITMLSRYSNNVKAFIIDYNIGLDVDYKDGTSYKTNVILIGTTNDRKTCRPVSVGGDSGSCVYHTGTGKLIGMLLGRANNFSLVLPIQATLNSIKLQTI